MLPIFDTGGRRIALAAAENYRRFRKRNITLAEGHDLLHRDRDFDPFEAHFGLRVIHP